MNQENPYIKLAIELVQKHCNKDEEAFRATAHKLVEQLDVDGKTQCSGYVLANLHPQLAFTPMEAR